MGRQQKKHFSVLNLIPYIQPPLISPLMLSLTLLNTGGKTEPAVGEELVEIVAASSADGNAILSDLCGCTPLCWFIQNRSIKYHHSSS